MSAGCVNKEAARPEIAAHGVNSRTSPGDDSYRTLKNITRYTQIKIRRGLVAKALDSHARGCGFKSCLAQGKVYWWGKVTGAHLH